MRGLMDKSLNFWKNDLKMSKIGSGCCCQRDIIIEEPKIQGGVPEELPFYEPAKKGATIFKTIKKEEERNPLTINDNFGKIEKNNSSENREKKKYNDWNNDEDELLIRLCNSHYYKKWKKIATIIGNGKTPRMCAYRIKKLEKEENQLNLTKLKQYEELNKKMKEQDKLLKDSMSTKSEKSSSLIELKKRKKMRKLINFRLPKSLKSIPEKKPSETNDNIEIQYYNKTVNDLKNLKIDEFLEPLSKKVNSENKKSEKADHDMKSNNSSNDRIKNHIQFFNFSRKNSPEEEIILSNKNSNDFKNAYDNVFVYKKESNSGSELNRNISMEDDTEMGLKEYHTERINHAYPNGFNNLKNEMNMKQGIYNKLYYLDLNNVDQIVNNSKEDIESKNIKLAKFLIEINNLSKIANQDEIKTLMQIQAKILESMISLTKHSQIQNREV